MNYTFKKEQLYMSDNVKILQLQKDWVETKNEKYLWSIYLVTIEVCKRIIIKQAKIYIDDDKREDIASTIALNQFEKMKDNSFLYSENPVSYLHFLVKRSLFKPTNDELMIKALNTKDINERNTIIRKLTIDGRGRHNSKKPRKKKNEELSM